MEADIIVSIVSVIIASFAFGLAIWNFLATRKHNRLLVTPHLIVHHDTSQNGLIYTLENNGVGPAIITEFSLITSNQKYPLDKPGVYDEVLNDLEAYVEHERYVPSVGEYISAGKKIELFKCLEVGDNDELQSKIRKILDNLECKVVYTSIYKEKSITYIGNS